MTRRTFSYLTAAAPLLGQYRPIRAAMVGSGHGHAASKAKTLRMMRGQFELLGVCRPNPEEPVLRDQIGELPTLDYAAVLKDPSIEFIAVEGADAAENLEWAQQAIDAGKWVHLDKPPGANLAGLKKLLDDAARRGRIVQMGYQWRYHEGMQAAMEAARRGWLGRVYRFRASIDKPIDAAERKHLAKYRGGMMFSEGCHLIDRATALLGKPTKVTGFIRHHSPIADGLADNSLVVLDYPNAVAEISLAGFDPLGNQHRYVEILGTNGSAKAQPFAPVRLTVELKQAAGPYDAGVQTRVPPGASSGMPYIPDFVEMAGVIREGVKPTYSAEHDLMTQAVLLEACGML